MAGSAQDSPEPIFFATPADLQAWFEQHHETSKQLMVGFHKKGSGLPSITWPESVDEALCVGWIDGVRRRIDDTSYMIRFTPRKPRSTWSAVNIKRVVELTEQGRMRPAGLSAFAARSQEKSEIYAYEQGEVALEPHEEQGFQANAQAWAFFGAQPAWYRKTALWWVVSSKRPETRAKRLQTLIADSAEGRTLAQLTRWPKA